MVTSTQETYYTLQEVADRLKVSYRTVTRWVTEGKLAAFKVDHQWRVAASDLEEFLKARRRERRA